MIIISLSLDSRTLPETVRLFLFSILGSHRENPKKKKSCIRDLDEMIRHHSLVLCMKPYSYFFFCLFLSTFLQNRRKKKERNKPFASVCVCSQGEINGHPENTSQNSLWTRAHDTMTYLLFFFSSLTRIFFWLKKTIKKKDIGCVAAATHEIMRRCSIRRVSFGEATVKEIERERDKLVT